MATTLPLDEAARRLGIHQATLRRRLHKGLVRGVKQETPQGYVWLVELDEADAGAAPTSTYADGYAASPQPPAQDGLAQEVALLKDHVQDLRDTVRAREREVQELHVTINRLLLALPAPLAPVATSPNGVAHDPAAGPPGHPNGMPETQSAPPARDPAGRLGWWPRMLAWMGGA